jgi:CRP-like cAMP-binding protein
VRSVSAVAVLGDMALLRSHTSNRRSATAVAISTTTTLVVSRAAYNAVLLERHETELRDKLSLFRVVDVFAALSLRDQKAVGCAMVLEVVPAQGVFVRAGAPFQGLALIRAGSVRLLRGGAGGKGACQVVEVVERRGVGQVVGEDALVHSSGVHNLTVVAELACEFYVLGAQV